jgi:hypothetical protein
VLVTFDVLSIVCPFLKAARTLDDISGFNFRLATREIGKQNLLFLAVLASKTEIPLSGDKGAHSLKSSISLTDERTGALSVFTYTGRGRRASRRIAPLTDTAPKYL